MPEVAADWEPVWLPVFGRLLPHLNPQQPKHLCLKPKSLSMLICLVSPRQYASYYHTICRGRFLLPLVLLGRDKAYHAVYRK